jgi:hypothetical protein
MFGPQFLYFIRNENKQFAVFQGGALSWTGQAMPLEFSPDGWMDLNILTERNKKYFGLDRTYGTPQKFVEDAAGILKSIFYTKGIQGTANLIIAEQKLFFSSTEYGFYYSTLCKCEIDFSTYVHEGESVTAQVLDGELHRMLEANESTVYEIDIDSNGVNLVLDGVKLKNYANYIVADPVTGTGNDVLTGNHIIGLQLTSVESRTQLGAQTQARKNTDDPQVIKGLTTNFLLTTTDDPLELNWDYSMEIEYSYFYKGGDVSNPITIQPPPANLYYDVWACVIAPDGSFSRTLIQHLPYKYKSQDILVHADHTSYFAYPKPKGTASLPGILKNSKVFLAGGLFDKSNEESVPFQQVATPLRYIFRYLTTTSTGALTDPNVTVNYYSVFPTSTVKALEALTLFNQLVSKATDGKYKGESTLLATLGTPGAGSFKYKSYPKVLYTSGDGVRGLSHAVIKTTISDFFQDQNSTNCVGLGILNNVVRLETKAFWLTATGAQIIALGECSDLKISPAVDFEISGIDVGCPNQTYGSGGEDDINGRYEFNMTQHYTTPQNKMKNVLDLTTRYRRDMYGIEYTRINSEGKLTSDADSDNDVFVMHVENKITSGTIPISIPGVPTINLTIPPFYKLDRTANKYVTGLLDKGSAFNVMLSPKHCLYRHSDFLRSCLDKMDNLKVVFTSADKPVRIVTSYPNGITIDERADARIGSFAAQIFKPYIFELTSEMPETFLEGSPIKKFTTTALGGRVSLAGFPMKVGIQPGNNKAQTSQLLCSPEVDLLQLIDIWE